jgi:hypothetical protein
MGGPNFDESTDTLELYVDYNPSTFLPFLKVVEGSKQLNLKIKLSIL